MNVAFTGKIIAAEPVQQGTTQQGQPWASQNYIIEELNQQYPSRAVFQVYGTDKIQQFNIQVGEVITAHLGMRANQSRTDGRWFNRIDCWKVDRFGAQQPQQPMYGAPQRPQGQVMQSQVGQTPQQTYQQPSQPTQQFPPQVDASGQPIGQQPQSYAGQPQQKPLPF